MRTYLARFAQSRPTPDDWIYVFNFAAPDHPNAIRLPAGRGSQFARDLERVIREAQQAIPRTFDSDDYERKRRDALSDIGHRRDALFEELQAFAAAREFAVELTPTGFVNVPLLRGQPISREEFARLPAPQRDAMERRGEEIQAHVSDVLREVRQLDREASERVNRLEREVALFTVGPFFEDLREKYRDVPEVCTYLDEVQKDLPEHVDDFRAVAPVESGLPVTLAQAQQLRREDHLARYQVNVLIDNSHLSGAPVVSEANPTHANLVGRIEYRAFFGGMTTDFPESKPGALHRANGGFLILHIGDVLRNPLAWEALKRALQGRQIQIENLSEQYSILPTASVRPEPIPLDIKVILIGPPVVYRLLQQLDEGFGELFKVRADFAPEMAWSDQHVGNYAAFVSRCVRDNNLRHFDRAAVARVVESGARARDHQRKLSTRLLDIADLVTEASFWAGEAGHAIVRAADVERAIAQKDYRVNLTEERVHELIADGTVMIATTGERVGQVNGLALLDLGDYQFARPTRISARVALGRGGLQSIEREIELSGPIHSKGFLVLSGYLASTYAQDMPLSIAATLTFEQSYDEVEGDSASCAELYALLSELSELPLRQDSAVTGSVNQHGEVQAVGGVTRKIEGFFDVCRTQGLTGRQGVIIPAANVQHLMLSERVIEAVAAGTFQVWAVRTIDEGIELLTGRTAGQRGPDGQYPEGSVHRLVADRLQRYATGLRSFVVAPDGLERHATEAFARGRSKLPRVPGEGGKAQRLVKGRSDSRRRSP